ncbi:MAG: hypothetical protein WCC48_05165 [Anaeromyxobacteraceae bacterium]
MGRLVLVLGASAALAGGCNLFFDPDTVPRPPDAPPIACTPVGCAGVACGYVDCGTVCKAGSGCVVTHAVTGGFSAGGSQPLLPASGRYVSSGSVTGSTAAAAAAASGHQVTGGAVH